MVPLNEIAFREIPFGEGAAPAQADRLRFSIRLMTVFLVACCGCEPLGSGNKKSDKKPEEPPNHAVEYLRSKGGSFQWIDPKVFQRLRPRPAGPHWTAGLRDDKLTDADLLHLKEIEHLTQLSIVGCKNISDQGMATVGELSSLTSLGISSMDITDKGIENIAKLRELKSLALRKLPRVTDRGLDKVADISTLERLTLAYLSKISDDGFKRFGRLQKLKYLELAASNLPAALPISDEALKHLKGLEQLEELNLNFLKITDASAAELAQLPSLKILQLEGTDVGNASLKLLSASKSLRSLNVSKTKVDDDGLRHVKEFPALEGLSLRHVPITDEGLKHLQETKLTGLSLVNARVSDEGLKCLQKLPLTGLDLLVANDKLTDKGISYLEQIKTLKRLFFQRNGNKVTEEGLRRLQNALPDLRINTGKK